MPRALRLSMILLAAALRVRAGAAEEAKKEGFKLIRAAELEAALKSKTPPAVFDANSQSTREKACVIPGAHLLSSFNKYDPAKELPALKSAPLVFYCANTMCTASHEAAQRAVSAGYRDVSVMADGIFGWRDAGKACASAGGEPKKLEPRQVQALRDLNGAVVVDVREAEERLIVVPGTQWFPMSRARDEKAWEAFSSKLPKDKTVVFHCAAGGRAKRAAEKLAKGGFRAAYFESPDQWKAAGLSVEDGPAK